MTTTSRLLATLGLLVVLGSRLAVCQRPLRAPVTTPPSRVVIHNPRYGIDSLSVDSTGDAFFLGRSVRRGFWHARLEPDVARTFLTWVQANDCPNRPLPRENADSLELEVFAPCGLLLCDYDCGYVRYESGGAWHSWFVNPDSLRLQLINNARSLLARSEWQSLGL